MKKSQENKEEFVYEYHCDQCRHTTKLHKPLELQEDQRRAEYVSGVRADYQEYLNKLDEEEANHDSLPWYRRWFEGRPSFDRYVGDLYYREVCTPTQYTICPVCKQKNFIV